LGTTTMKLYYLAGSCALAPHIALELSGLSYKAIRVERGKQTDPSYLAISPLGRVPALVTSDHNTITEVPAVLCYIADMAPDRGLLPGVGTRQRYQALQWMAYLASTVHPAFGRFWRPERFADIACSGSVEQAAAKQLANDFAYIDTQLEKRKWVTGADFSVADLHLFVFGRLGLRITPSTRDFPNFYRHTLSIAALAATLVAISQEGITFEGPKSGPG
jgi:glutathione S-transferase